MKVRNLCALSGLAAVGLVASAAMANDPHISTANVVDAIGGGGTNTSACDTLVYDPGDPQVINTGYTVGQPSSDRFEVYQKYTPESDVTVCAIGVNGWHVRGPLGTINIFADVDGCPDIDNPLTGAIIDLGSPDGVWVDVEVDPVCLEGGTLYWIGTDTGTDNDHWSAIYRGEGLSGDSGQQTRNDVCPGSTLLTTAMRLFGEEGCGDCLTLSVNTLTAGQTGVWTIDGADPGSLVAVVYGFSLGSSSVNGQFGFCATFGINGINGPGDLVGTGTADGSGQAVIQRRIPGNASGVTVHTQAAQQGTCPDECVSNIDSQTIQ